MRTIIRRTLLIFIGIVIAFFVYSRIDPQGASKLVNAIKGGSGSIQTGIVVTDLSNTGTNMGDSMIIPSTTTGSANSGSDNSSGTFWGWLRGSSTGATMGTSTGTLSGSTSTGNISQSGNILTSTNTGTSTLPQDFLDAVAAPDGSNTTNNEGKADTTTNIETPSITTTTRTITKTISTTTSNDSNGSTVINYTFNNNGSSSLSQQDIEDTKQLFSQLIDGADKANSNTTTNTNNTSTITSFILTNYCRTVGSEGCTNYQPNIQLRGNGTAPSTVEFRRVDTNNNSTQYINSSNVRIVQITTNARIAYLPIYGVGSNSCSNGSQRNLNSIQINFTTTINNQQYQGSNTGYGCGQ